LFLNKGFLKEIHAEALTKTRKNGILLST